MDVVIAQLINLFKTKEWPHPLKDHIFKKLINLLKNFSETERMMIIELFRKFEIIEAEQYPEELVNCINKIDEDLIQNVNRFYVMPLKDPAERAKTKSSNMVAYQVAHSDRIVHTKIGDKDRILTDTPEGLPLTKINSSHTKMILLVDDFIGTGGTARSCYQELLDLKISKTKIIILTIAAMSEGVEKIQKDGITIYSASIKKKGISVITDQIKREAYKKSMSSIEEKAEIPEEYKFGYGRSESLLKLIRMPNNTFPVFWHKNFPEQIFRR